MAYEDRPRSSRKSDGDGFWSIVMYLWGKIGLNPSGIFAAMLLLAAFGIVVYFGKGVQGKNCNSAMNYLNEDNYAAKAGCWINRFFNFFDDSFDQPSGSAGASFDGNLGGQGGSGLIAPPATQSTQPIQPQELTQKQIDQIVERLQQENVGGTPQVP